MILQYLLNILLGIDHLLNAIIGGNPDDTISARLGRNYPNSEMRKFIDFIFGEGHCKQVAENGDGGKAIIK